MGGLGQRLERVDSRLLISLFPAFSWDLKEVGGGGLRREGCCSGAALASRGDGSRA